MKKIILGFVVGFALLFVNPGHVLAAATTWDLTGIYTINFHCTSGCGGDYPHTLVVSTVNLDTGAFSGTGFYNPMPSITWTITGLVTGSNLTFHIAYDWSSYTVDGTGIIAPDGTLSGNATGPGQTFTWASTSGAATSVTLDWGSKLSSPNCNTKGSPIINATEKVKNDVDSGVGGVYWAFDDLNRQIKVWQMDDGTFCALVRYEGNFTTIAGPSPQGTETVSDGWKGSFQGGYRAIITGNLLPTPTWATKGFVGNVDYGCTKSGDCSLGYVDWVKQYFNHDSNTGFSQTWWGWIYHGGIHGTWVNASSGNAGDIK